MSLLPDSSAAQGVLSDVSAAQAKKYTSSSHKTSSRLDCPACHSFGLHRGERKGFWQKLVASRFGYYPWECTFCREKHLLKDRGLRRRSRTQQ